MASKRLPTVLDMDAPEALAGPAARLGCVVAIPQVGGLTTWLFLARPTRPACYNRRFCLAVEHILQGVVLMPRGKLLDNAILQAALEGLEFQRQRIEGQIAQVQCLLAPRRGPTPVPAAGKPKRTISAAGRKRIAAAQRRRWAALKKAKKESAPKKRRLSAEGRRHIIEATRKRWAEFRAKKARMPAVKRAAKPSAQPRAAE